MTHPGRMLQALGALLLVAACSSSEDASSAHPDASTGGDAGVAGAGGGGTGGASGSTGACVSGGDCSGCDTCKTWCECLAPSAVDACVASCNGTPWDGGTGTGGQAGAGGATGSAGVLDCAGTDCFVSQGQECCYALSAGWGQCKDQGTACYGTRVRCDGPEDCDTGQVCCARLASNGQSYTQVQCRSSCASSEFEVCTSNPKVCPTSTSCLKSALLPAVSVCK